MKAGGARRLSRKGFEIFSAGRARKGWRMKHYYIDRDAAQSRTEVHASWCPSMKGAAHKDYVGLFADPRKAVSVAAEKGYGHACGCAYCCPITPPKACWV